MRVALFLIALLGLSAADARADVFVPFDPPPFASARCAAGAGDVLAASGDEQDLRVNLGGGGWQPFAQLIGCPAVDVAADGTAAIVGSAREDQGAVLSVRTPGGVFGAPIALGWTYQEPALAVAPGGWAATAWIDSEQLSVVLARPDGTTTRGVLDRGDIRARAGDLLFGVQVGIDASGNTTVVWQHYADRTTRVRVARGTAGGAPVLGADPPGDASETGALSLAVAPGGSTLLAWSSIDGVIAMLDGGPPELVDTTSRDATALAAAVEDDGSAVLAYARESNEIVAVERAGGAWRGAHVLKAGVRLFDGYDDRERSGQMLAAVARGGRAVAVWREGEEYDGHVLAAVGQAGGAWGPAQRLSSITRFFAAPVGLSVDGSRVTWIEAGLGLRGAALAPARLDVTAPVVHARMPDRVAPTRTGRFTVRVPVDCSEACDAMVAFPGGERDRGSTARALAAGRRRVLTLRSTPEFAEELLESRHKHRVRLRLTVTDRAGNVVRRSTTVRVPVIDKPIREFKVASTHHFGMGSAAGNRLVAELVNSLIDGVADGASNSTLRRRFARRRAAIKRAGYKNIDTLGVRDKIYDALDLPFTRSGRNAGFVID